MGHYILIVLLPWGFIAGCRESSSPPPQPSRFTDMVLFDVEGLDGCDLSDTDLQKKTSYEASAETVKAVFAQTRFGTDEPFWKGSYLGVVVTGDGEKYRIAVSLYGGFFKVLGHDGYFQTVGSSLDRMRSLQQEATSQVFIPARKRANERGSDGQIP